MEEKTKKTPMKTFVFDLRWHEAIGELHQFERLEMYDAICRYAKDGTELQTDDPMKRLALRMIYDEIDSERSVMAITEE